MSDAVPQAAPGPETGPVTRACLRPDEPGCAEALDAWLALQARFALEPVEGRAHLEARGDPLRAAAGLPPAPRDAAARLGRAGFALLPCRAAAFPEPLRALCDPPLALSLRGEVERLAGPAVAIVGSRAASRHGRRFAARLARALSSAGVVVVSGLARGIDAAAHEGALEGRAGTVAVLACGPDRVYPPEHRALAARVARCGVVLTEMPLGTPPRGPYFPLRNRLISGLSRAVVVVEARRRSGSLVTARHALEQGREVLVVPGPVDTAACEGSNALLRDGAAPVLSESDVFAAIGHDPQQEAPADLAGIPVEGWPIARALFESGPLSRDELSRRLELPPSELALQLLGLELEGWVETERSGLLQWSGPSLSSSTEPPGAPEPEPAPRPPR